MGRPSTNLLSRDLIAREALAMYDAEGEEQFSLRRLAERLGVKSPSLYHHISGLGDLVDAMHDVIEEDAGPAFLDPAAWREQLGMMVRTYREVYGAHRAVAMMIARRPVPELGVAWYDEQIGSLEAIGLTREDALRVSGTIEILVFGSLTITYPEAFDRTSPGFAERFPRLEGALASTPASDVDDLAFEWALESLLDRVARLVA